MISETPTSPVIFETHRPSMISETLTSFMISETRISSMISDTRILSMISEIITSLLVFCFLFHSAFHFSFLEDFGMVHYFFVTFQSFISFFSSLVLYCRPYLDLDMCENFKVQIPKILFERFTRGNLLSQLWS